MSLDLPSMQCTLQLHIMLTTLTQNLPDQSKFASYTPEPVALEDRYCCYFKSTNTLNRSDENR